MKALLLLAATPFAVLLFPDADPMIARHTETLQKAQSVVVKFKLIESTGVSEDDTLTLSRQNKFRWDSPAKLVISDGTTITTYNKGAKKYSQTPFTEEAEKIALSA